MAHEPVPDPIDDQPPARKFIASVGDEISANRRRFSKIPPKVDLPARRYWEMALEEDPDDYPIF